MWFYVHCNYKKTDFIITIYKLLGYFFKCRKLYSKIYLVFNYKFLTIDLDGCGRLAEPSVVVGDALKCRLGMHQRRAHLIWFSGTGSLALGTPTPKVQAEPDLLGHHVEAGASYHTSTG